MSASIRTTQITKSATVDTVPVAFRFLPGCRRVQYSTATDMLLRIGMPGASAPRAGASKTYLGRGFDNMINNLFRNKLLPAGTLTGFRV